LLLPDARVLLGGGEQRFWDYVIYEPPYLTQGLPRPVFETHPSTPLNYNSVYSIQFTIDAGATVSRVVLMRPGSTTHHFDFDERYIQLPTTVFETAPPSPPARFAQFTTPVAPPSPSNPYNARTAPPGWYMCFLISDNGVPSVAHWVKLQ